jgi:ribosomal protein S18 acetylase RimI-like enzyme
MLFLGIRMQNLGLMAPSRNTSLIRRASPDDATHIRSIARAAYAKYIARIGREPAPMVADFAAEIAADHVVVIESAGLVVGYLIGWPETDAYFIDNIAIDPMRQGEGLGRKLIDHAIQEARRLGFLAVRLYTNVAMNENLSMYAHLGFSETHQAWENGFHRIYMRLNLV